MLLPTESRSNVWWFRAAERLVWSDMESRHPLLRFTDPMQTLVEWAAAKLAKVCALILEVKYDGLQRRLFAAVNALDA
jgi:hypothetical protein